jgi:hypothetical protein
VIEYGLNNIVKRLVKHMKAGEGLMRVDIVRVGLKRTKSTPIAGKMDEDVVGRRGSLVKGMAKKV